MIVSLRRRSLLPVLATLITLGIGLGFSHPALAQDLVYLDPAHVTCQLVPLAARGRQRCDVFVDSLVVHEGRDTTVVESNGDCVKCRGVVARALADGREILMLRGMRDAGEIDWDEDDFFTVAGGKLCR